MVTEPNQELGIEGLTMTIPRFRSALHMVTDSAIPASVYCVFAVPTIGTHTEFLGAYTSPEKAQAYVDSQPADLQGCLAITAVALDAGPSDPYWTGRI